MLKIGDFSKFSRVSVKALRYYDEIGLLKPVQVDRFTGYRYYAADQLPLLNRIIGLKDLGLSLEEISQLLGENKTTQQLIDLLQAKQRETLERLHREQDRLRKVEEWLRRVEKEGTMPAYDVRLKSTEAQTVVSLRDIIPTYGDTGRLFAELYPYLARQLAQFAGPPMAIYYDHEYKEKDVDMELAIPIAGKVPTTDRIKISQLPPVEQAACLIHKGSYDNFNQAYKALMDWVENNGYQIAGPNREIYLKGPGEGPHDDPANYITEIQLPLRKVVK